MQIVLGNKSLSAAIEMPNNFNWAHATGISSGNPLVNVQPSDVYLIGSVTKTIIAACILPKGRRTDRDVSLPIHVVFKGEGAVCDIQGTRFV